MARKSDLLTTLRKRIRPYDITVITIVPHEGTATVEIELPLDPENGKKVTTTVILDISGNSAEPLQDSIFDMIREVVSALQVEPHADEEYPCASCTGVCCREGFDIDLTEEDVKRLRTGKVVVEDHADFHDNGETYGGFVAVLHRDDQGDDEVCSLLGPGGSCSVHKHRPQVCRDWDPWSCELREEDPVKRAELDGKVRLPVAS